VFCLSCGNKIPDNALFCNQCGRRQNTTANPQTPSMSNFSTESKQEASRTMSFIERPTPQPNITPTTLETPTQLNSSPMQQSVVTPHGFHLERNAGFIIAGIGGIVGIISFFSMSYLSYGFITATGQQLASLGYQYASQYSSSYNSNSSQYNSLLLLWLLPVIAGIIILIAGIQLFRSNETGKKASAGWLIGLAIIAMLGLIGAYIYITIQIQNSTSSSVSITSVIGSGIWIYMVAMVAVIVGGIIQIKSSH
jgi:zinc-ribbon domain